MIFKHTTVVFLVIFYFDQIASQAHQKKSIDLNVITSIWGKPQKNATLSLNGETCECVPFYLCQNGTIIENGANIIDRRMQKCADVTEICCSPKDVKPLLNRKGCGYSNPNGVISKPKNSPNNQAKFGEFPWMVAIYTNQSLEKDPENEENFECGGALIHPKVVITAAHCVRNYKGVLKIRVGDLDPKTTQEPLPYEERYVQNTEIHPEYYSGGSYNDIALLFLKKPVKLAPHVNLICLPPKDMVVDHGRCLTSGWGKDITAEEYGDNNILKKIELPMVPRQQCESDLRNTRLGQQFELHESFVCAGGEQGKDTCTGDGGSPLVCPMEGHKDRYVQIGIVSWGLECGQENVPGLYTNVALFKDWIDKHLDILQRNQQEQI